MQLYLDVDGVLVDFTTGLTRVVKVPYDYPRMPYPFKAGEWNYFPELEKRFGVTFEQCNAACTEKFWADLWWMFDGHSILSAVYNTICMDDAYLLTSPMPNLGSASGKMAWVEKNLPAMKKKTIITNVDKGKFAAPDRILIDDCDRNIDSWRSNGGIGIVCPRPWNSLHHLADDAPNYIYAALAEIVENV